MRNPVATALAALAVLATAAGLLNASGVLRRRPPLVETPEAVGWGRKVFTDRCLHCHSDVPLAGRVAGWSPERAYEAIGRLPEIYASMPPFRGTDDERRALAVFISAVGAGRARY